MATTERWGYAAFPACGCVVVAGRRRYPCDAHKPPKIDRRRKPKRVVAAWIPSCPTDRRNCGYCGGMGGMCIKDADGPLDDQPSPPFDVCCPKCGAQRGQRCKTLTTAKATDTHHARHGASWKWRAVCTERDDRIHHSFLPVDGHPDDDECTHRDDGTDATYCGMPEAAHCGCGVDECPGGHGSQCCGFPDLCREALNRAT